ncbi:uncharacterized protein SOCEGT47_082440 [Sorangium cellulosum]|uniref:Uncharacterized protein n=1 Tax=Sorangium cellulosum TaxID=56 RepID=A0A4P2QE15_SORCE|nr:uncharacterized protein SOCEGT47_082440 [Sorangium cellulosum]
MLSLSPRRSRSSRVSHHTTTESASCVPKQATESSGTCKGRRKLVAMIGPVRGEDVGQNCLKNFHDSMGIQFGLPSMFVCPPPKVHTRVGCSGSQSWKS